MNGTSKSVATGYGVWAHSLAPAASRFLGWWPSWDTAVEAAEQDVLALLREAGGGWVSVRHDVVGDGVDGPSTVHPFVTTLGPDAEWVSLEECLREAGEWLAGTRGGSGSRE